MRELTKAQLTVGLLAYFAAIWYLIFKVTYPSMFDAVLTIVLYLVLLLVLSYVILALLEWVKIFDLKSNAIITLLVLLTTLILYNL